MACAICGSVVRCMFQMWFKCVWSSGSIVHGMGKMWFSSISDVVRMCVWHDSDMSQMFVVKCCGSVVHGMFQMVCSIGSGVGRCVCPGVCSTMLWFSGVWRGSYMVQQWFRCGSNVCV